MSVLKRFHVLTAGIIFCTTLVGLAVWSLPDMTGRPPARQPAVTSTTASAAPTSVPTGTSAATTGASDTVEKTGDTATGAARPPGFGQAGKLVFGLGPSLDSDATSPVADQLGMFTTWYNSPNDFGFLTNWSKDLIPQVYTGGRAIHLVVWLGGAGRVATVQTRYGPACGRDYPLSSSFLSDTRRLAQIFGGEADGPPLYVTLFTELQTYPCKANTWAATPEVTNYYLKLKDQYTAAMDIFHSIAPNARVSLGWGGWQARWDDPGKGGGKSLIGHFDDVLRQSDFQSFQAMDSKNNVNDIRDMTRILGKYGPVMVAHYKPDDGSPGTWHSDLRAIFTDDYIRQVTGAGLFAFSLMDSKHLTASAESLRLVRDAATRYGTRTD
ncbi:hypothetical protein FsymDg_0461 [Candidatus Protofrankia datiscae]|uniref:GH26 domain-containing protein n=1 Tax=Candidatus Protofrankia datiscae TaxID=2716812 RepID=F8B5F4_9ACTN|nr:hypothetical protein FsymDg_0461 [Candidatus Protofrankia datiscae]